jgi:NADH dehydrogenase (ubiquinone) 1 alpha subcomplex subunit 13
MPQDLPPTGGYGAVQYKVCATLFRPPSIPNSRLTDPLLQRNIPTRGLKPAYYLLGVGLVMAYGWRKIFIGAREKKYAPLECPQPCTCPIPPHIQLHTLPSQPTL